MVNHVFLPIPELESVDLLPEHQKWLEEWLRKVESLIDTGDIASSICLQGIISEIVLYGHPRIDWLGIMEEYLTDATGKPIAYSKLYGKRLHKFLFWLQSPVHAVYSRWWIEKVCMDKSEKDYSSLIKSFIQPNGWIYNPQVSCTNIRTRMKSERMMSAAMGIEILKFSDNIDNYMLPFQAVLSSEPITGFLSAEYFRIKALEQIESIELIPSDMSGMIDSCETELGYSDFSLKNKLDDYMGTQKRTEWDKVVHSPISSIHAYYIASFCDKITRDKVFKKIKYLKNHLQTSPFDIPPFTMRSIDIPFGTDITPLELIAASYITNI